MSQIKDLKFNEHTEVSTNTKPFDLEKYLNENWNALTEYSQSVNENIERINKNLDKNADELKNLQKDNTGNKTAIEAINKKNTEQDTNIQKNAKDIEVNQNNIKALQVENTEVKAENERLRSDIESISLVGEAEGESIDLEDSAGARFKKFGVSGNHSQETIKNIQTELLNAVITGGNTLSASKLGKVAEFECKANTQYTIKRNVSTSRFKAFESSEKWDRNSTIKTLKNEKELSKSDNTYTTTESAKYVYVFCWFSTGGDTSSNIPAITSSTECPSLNYSSEIKTVKDNINEGVCNKNLQKNKWENKTSAGASSNYRLTINIDDMNLKLNKKYVIQFKCNVDYSNSTVFVENSITGESLQISKLLYDKINKINYCVIEITEAIKALMNKNNCYIVIFNATGMDVNTYSEEMIFEGENKATDYEAHQEQTITMTVQQEMLKGDYFDWENEKEVHKWVKLIFDGTENWLQSGNIYPTFYVSPDEIASKFGIPTGLKALCNYFTQKNNIWGIDEIGFDTANLRPNHVDFRFNLGSNSTITTLEAWKNKLVEMYNSGNPLVLYFQIFTQDELDFTDEQKVVAKKIKETLHTYKNITHIYSTDETGPIMNVEYAKDPNTQNNNLQNQIDEIKQLISTTQTSAMLLDNLQKEVESEVE
jgi:hypothetical protein